MYKGVIRVRAVPLKSVSLRVYTYVERERL